MRILLSPDSFKGCLSSCAVCNAITAGIRKVSPEIEIMQFPSSDGGEGFCDCMGNLFGGEVIKREVTYPLGNKGIADFIFNKNTNTAYIELASAAGLNLVHDGERDILSASTYGVGELISAAIEVGAKTIVIGLGGSATNDCGIGLLAALGVVFLDKTGNTLEPIPYNLDKVRNLDKSKMLDVSQVGFIAACDVKNPLCGKNGAAKVFARQKGASDEEIECLDNASRSFARTLNIDPDNEGYGAAGGAGMALMEFLDAKYVSGGSLLVSSDSFQKALVSADLVITGEGNTDAQTAEGKLVSVVASEAKKHNVPVMVISGGLSKGYEALYSIGVTECYSLVNDKYDAAYCITHAEELLTEKSEAVIKAFIKQK